jgi:Ca2+-binding RTX toxin-like protein
VLLGASLGGAPARASVDFERTDVSLPGAPESVALGDLDGVNGKDIAIAMPLRGSLGVMLNHGDGTFAAVQEYTAGPECAGLAVDITLGDVTQPTGNRLLQDGKLDAYVACTPYVVRLTGNGTGALGNPEPFNLNLPPSLGPGTLDLLALVRRPDGNPVPLLALQHGVGSFGREVCISYDLDGEDLVCNSTPVAGPLAVGDLNGAFPGVPPDEIVTGEGVDKMGVFGFAHQLPTYLSESSRTVPGDPPGIESAAIGDLDDDGDREVLVGQYVNSLADRVASIHYFKWDPSGNPGGLDQVATTLPSIPGLDAVAIADVDDDGHSDVVGAGVYGRGVVHPGDGAGGFLYGQDVPQLGYQDPGKATRVTMAVGDLTGDGLPELVTTDASANAVMIQCNASQPASGCAPPVANDDVAVITEDAGATTIDVLANDTDPDGGAKRVASITQPAHGGAAIAGSGVTYGPAADYCNDLGGPPDTFSYTLNGGSSATVAVTVQCVFDAPPVPPPPPPPPPPPSPVVPRTCEQPGTTPFLIGTPGADVLVGTAGRDVLSGRGGDDCLFGRSADDRMSGGTGADLLNGSGGSDRLSGDAGDDKINAGNGNDTITPGPGKDSANGNGGNDTISARDGARDAIDCGAGRDKVTADRSDTVKANCEHVTRPSRHG